MQIGDEDNDLVALLDNLAEALLTSTCGANPLDPFSVGKVVALRGEVGVTFGLRGQC